MIEAPLEVTPESMQEYVKTKTNEIRLKLNKNIIPFMSILDNEYIVGFATEPTRDMKAIALGKATKGPLVAGLELLNWCLLPEYSDARFLSTDSKYDALVFSAALKIMNTIEVLTDQCITINLI
jgi:hypothetical protein